MFAACASDPPDASADVEERFPVTRTPQGIPIRAGLTFGSGHELGSGFEVAEGSLLVGLPFPNEIAFVFEGVPVLDDGWTAVLLVTDDLDVVFERYLDQVRVAGFHPRPEYGDELCVVEDGITECAARAEDGPSSDGRGVVLSGWQGTSTLGLADRAQSHVVMTYRETGDGRSDSSDPVPDLVPPDLHQRVPEAWPALPAVGEPTELLGSGDRVLAVPEGTALVAHTAGAGFNSHYSVFVVADGVDPEALLISIAKQTAAYEPTGGPNFAQDDGYDVWTMFWTTGQSYAARVFEREGSPTFLVVDRFPTD